MATQDNRTASVTTPLGPDILLFRRMTGHEEMSRLFEYEVELLLEGNTLGSLITVGFPIKDLLGQGMSIALALPAGGTRHFHGLVTQFKHYGTEEGGFLYRAVLRPWLWFLTRTSNCRIFQDLSVPDIIRKIFEKNSFSDFEMQYTQTYDVRSYCVQYRESDFNFVSRLMEYEGLFYFFKHDETKHTLVIADSVSAYQTVDGYATIPYYPPENAGQRLEDHIFDWQTSHKVQSGAYVLKDYDFKNTNSPLLSTFQRAKSHTLAEFGQFDYPGNYRDADTDDGLDVASGDSYANVRLDELQSDYEVIQGAGNAMGLTTGMLFTLKEHYMVPENVGHIVVFVSFFISSNQYRTGSDDESHYECHFRAIRATQQFRPQRLTPTPFVQGPQTATVVGKTGEEIWTDKYGRVKVQFHWERDGKKDETSSCWVRVATPIAGKKWGWVSLPRMGQEVVVSFLEGNPDKPLITGSVYNGTQMPPYELPANQTQSGLKSRSSKGGAEDNFNEIRFEDKKDSEEVYVHAEKDFNCVIENSETRKIGLDKKDKGDQTIEIHNDRTVTLNEGHDTLTVKKGNRVTSVDTGNDTLAVKKGNRESSIDTGNDTLKIKLGNQATNVDAGKSTLEAMQSIELIVGGNSIKIDQTGITLKGVMISIEADVKLDAKSPLTTVKADAVLTLNGTMTNIN